MITESAAVRALTVMSPRRRTVNDYEIIFVAHILKEVLEHALAVGFADEFEFGTHKVDA